MATDWIVLIGFVDISGKHCSMSSTLVKFVNHLLLRLQPPSIRKCKKVFIKMYLWKNRFKMYLWKYRCNDQSMLCDLDEGRYPYFQQRRVFDLIKRDNLIRLH